jgi:hypothetical protein
MRTGALANLHEHAYSGARGRTIHASATGRFNKLDALIFAIIVLVGVIHLPYPFFGDQALFTLGAANLSKGRVLYRDFFDIKPPGIYGFYGLAGRLFGFNEVGIHTFELLYLSAFSVVLTITLKGYFQSRALASLTPLLTVGFYYGVTDTWHLTQLEGLVGFPLYVTLWCALRSTESARQRFGLLALSGLMGGAVMLCKPMFLPLLLAFWGSVFWQAMVREKAPFRAALRRIAAPLLLGTALPIVATCLYFAQFDMLYFLYRILFDYPPRILANKHGGYGILVNGLRWFTNHYAALLALGFLGAYVGLKRHRDLLTLNLVLRVILGLGLVFVQRMWWQYHYLLIMVPLGVLGVKGIDVLWAYLTVQTAAVVTLKDRLAVCLCLALYFAALPFALVFKTAHLANAGFALHKEQRRAYQAQFNPTYDTAMAEVAFLREPESLPGDIYVFGDPIYYLLSGRNQAIALQGWSLWYLAEQWVTLRQQLAEAQPPYIFVATEHLEELQNSSSETIRFLNDNYQILHQSKAGVWHVSRRIASVQRG